MKRLRTFAVLVVLAGSLAIPAIAQPGHSVVLSTVRIANFGNVAPGLYRGAQPKRLDFEDLAALGVKTVIDLQKWGDDDEPAVVEEMGMRYVRIPMTTDVPPTPDQIRQLLDLIKDSADQPVYLHCAGGRHRTGVMAAVYRMTKEGWTADQAYAEMKKYNFGAGYLHPEFKEFVFSYPGGRRDNVSS